MPTVCGYIVIQKESQSVQGVDSYVILFAGMSNVWKRYLFANPVTYYVTSSLLFEYVIIHLQPICALRCIYMMNSMVCLDGFSVIIQMVQGVTW